MAVQKRLVKVAPAKQTAKGTYPVSPDYVHGVDGGNVVDDGIKQDDFASTWDTRSLEGRDRISAQPAAAYGFYAMPASIGRYLFAATGAKTTTGTGPYTHVFKPATDLGYHAVWALYGTDWFLVKDAKLDELDIDFPNSGAAKVKAKWMGANMDPFVTAPSGGTTDRPTINGTLRSAGGLFQLEGSNVRVKSGSVKVTNKIDGLEDITKITPDDVLPGEVTVEVDLKLQPDDLTLYRKIMTGTTSGTTLSAVPLIGSALLRWAGPSGVTLQLDVPNFEYDPANLPAADPKGGAAELDIKGFATGAATDSFTFTLAGSTVATY